MIAQQEIVRDQILAVRAALQQAANGLMALGSMALTEREAGTAAALHMQAEDLSSRVGNLSTTYEERIFNES